MWASMTMGLPDYEEINRARRQMRVKNLHQPEHAVDERKTICCPFDGSKSEYPTMKESACERRILSRAPVCTECHVVNHIRERHGMPLVAKQEKRAPKPPVFKLKCACGAKSIPEWKMERMKLQPAGPICRECHNLARWDRYIQALKSDADVRRPKGLMAQIRDAAANGHAPSIAWVGAL